MAFNERGWGQRFKAMGDEAEGIFEQVYPQGCVKFGLSRPPINLARVPARIRYTPDYLTARGLVEVQGVGRDQTLKVKRDKLDCLCWWNTVFPVSLFVWDSKNKRHTLLALDQLVDLIDSGQVTLGHFHEGKAFFALGLEHVEGWTPYEPPTEDAA